MTIRTAYSTAKAPEQCSNASSPPSAQKISPTFSRNFLTFADFMGIAFCKDGQVVRCTEASLQPISDAVR